MYESFYGLKQKPFTITANPNFLFLSRYHEEALSSVLYAIQERLGFIELTGEVGTGKTTICRALLNRLDDKTKSAFIFNSGLSESQMMMTILDDLGIVYNKKDTTIPLFSILNQFLIDQLAKNNNVVLIIDEAQNLSFRALEQIRMLSNLEADNQKLIQIVLVGQPELKEKLKLTQLRQLRQRISVRYHIQALTQADIANYIYHRITMSGANGTGPIFDPKAIDEIFSYSGGIPRLINILCEKALLMGFVMETRRISLEMVKKCIAEIEGSMVYEHHS